MRKNTWSKNLPKAKLLCSYKRYMQKKAGQKLSALSRITPCMDISRRHLVLNAFYVSIQLLPFSEGVP